MDFPFFFAGFGRRIAISGFRQVLNRHSELRHRIIFPYYVFREELKQNTRVAVDVAIFVHKLFVEVEGSLLSFAGVAGVCSSDVVFFRHRIDTYPQQTYPDVRIRLDRHRVLQTDRHRGERASFFIFFINFQKTFLSLALDDVDSNSAWRVRVREQGHV